MEEKIRVLVVDDSALIREGVKAILISDPAIEVVGVAKDGKEGVEKALKLKPDVITMDLKMPLMGGLEAIESIMEDMPTPIIVVSSMDIKVIVTALGIGAMDFVAITDDIDAIAKDLIEKVKIASKVKALRRMNIVKVRKTANFSFSKKEAKNIIAIGVSTGGPQALQVLLAKFPANIDAAVLVVQHMSKGFIEGLVEWLKFSSHLDIRVAKPGELLKNAAVLFAPDDYNIGINEEGRILLSEDASKRLLHVPSIDVMMKSVAAVYDKNVIGIILTGMGSDGVEGINAIKSAGGVTIAQDQESSIIYGMNKIAIDKGYVDKVIPLDKIPQEVLGLLKIM